MTTSAALQTQAFDEPAADSFAGRIGNMLDAGAVSLTLSIGHRTDLFDVLADLPYGALRPGGVYLMQDIGGSAKLENNLDFPLASLLYAVSCTHCTPVPLGHGGAGFDTMWGWETAQDMLHQAGFASVERHVLAHAPTNVWFVAVKP
jgi:hypothetical protein